MGMINEDGTDGGIVQDYPEESASNYGSSVGWVTDSKAPAHGWDSDSSTEYVVMSIRRKEEEELRVAGAKLALKINGKATQAWIDSGSPISIFTIGELKRTLATANVHLKPLDPKDDQFRDYGNNPLKFLGKMQVTLHSNGWTSSVDINVIGGCRPSIIGRDLMPALGLMLVQAPPTKGVNSIHSQEGTLETDNDLDDWQKHFGKQFHHLFCRVGRIRNYKVQAEFFKNLTPIQQKGRRVPITLQEKVDKEIDKLLEQGHIQKLEECSDKYFVSPIFITVKKDGSVKLALESRELNKQVHKNKYQMPNFEELMDIVGQTISERKQGDVFFTTMDLTYAYGQLPLNENTSKHCNFSLVGGRSTGTYRFKTGFYGLTTMPAEFQRVMDAILAEFPCAHAFIDDILVISKGTKIDVFDAARDVWFPYLHRSLVAAADGCKECTDAGKSLKPLCAKGDIGKVYEPREPNECLQLDFWGPIRYLNESSKYILVAFDRFSRWPSAMICGNSKSDKVLKFIEQYISQHGVPRKIFMDQGSSFTSKAVKSFCNSEGIEIIYSPVNDHHATGCVKRTIGSLKIFVLTYAKEKDSGNLESMIERALSALRFAPNATLKYRRLKLITAGKQIRSFEISRKSQQCKI